jgi:Ca2+-binding RTX toxin-like protein
MAGPHLNKDLESRSDAGWLPTETAPERRPLPRLGTAGSVMKALGTADRRGVRVAERSRIDGLALGAPVTATFVGVMLAKGGLTGAGSEQPDAGVVAANGLGPAQSTSSITLGAPAAVGAEDALGADEPALQTSALDPVAAGPTGAGNELPSGGEGPVMPPGASAPAEVVAGAAAPGGDITVNLSSTGLLLGDGLEAWAATGSDGPPIGAYAAGSGGDDTLQGTELNDQLAGGAGNDQIYGLGGDDWLDGGAGDDALYGGDGSDILLGGTGHDLLDGGAGDDLLQGGDGADVLQGGSGRDLLEGGAGNDSLDGGIGADRLSGGAGDDLLIVDNRADLALEQSYGADGGGVDTLQVDEGFSGSAVTFVFGDDLGATAEGTSADRQQVHGEIENLVLTGSVGHGAIGDGRDNSLVGNAGNNALYGGAGDDLLQGGDGDDLIDGGFGMDRLEGGAGRDILTGGEGADDLFGGADDDVLSGGLGTDRLYGEAGDDTYLIGLNDSAVDSVFDHEGTNHIVLEGVTDQTIKAAIVGDDLYLVADGNPVAVVRGYVGHEDSFAGVDLGAGILGVSDLLGTSAGETGQEIADLVSEPGASALPPDDLLASYLPQPSYLSQPSLMGADGTDTLFGTSGADWLSGRGGNDDLQGGAGSDVLEGGAGSDLLQGGAGDDRYLFRSGEAGLDTLRDAEGSNVAELNGFTGARLEGVVVGQDLIVVADYAPVFKVENYVGNEASFAGVQVDDTFVATEDLFA